MWKQVLLVDLHLIRTRRKKAQRASVVPVYEYMRSVLTDLSTELILEEHFLIKATSQAHYIRSD